MPQSDQSGDPKDAGFDSVIEQDLVVLSDLVRAKVMTSASLTPNGEERATGERYFLLLLASFRKKHTGAQFVIQEDVGFGTVLHSDEQGDPRHNRLDWAVVRKTLRFDWTKPRELLIETQELADEGSRWLRNPNELRDLLGQLYNIMTQIGATIGRENRRCATSHDEGTDASERIDHDIAIIRKQLDAAHAQFLADVERQALFKYATGMALGAGAVLAVAAAIVGILAIEHVHVVNGIGFAAGAVGACVSVLERMTRGKLEINAQSGDGMITAFGALRPLVGAVFGFVVYLVIRSELISLFTLPKTTGPALAYVAVFGFVAGFNERFAQDILANASNARPAE